MISRLWVTPGEYSMKARSQSRQGSSSLGDDSSNAIFLSEDNIPGTSLLGQKPEELKNS